MPLSMTASSSLGGTEERGEPSELPEAAIVGIIVMVVRTALQIVVQGAFAFKPGLVAFKLPLEGGPLVLEIDLRVMRRTIDST